MSNILDILQLRQEKSLYSQHFIDLKFKSKKWFSRNLKAHFGCVNALAFSPNGQFLASGGDDRRILLWNVGQTLSKNDNLQRKSPYEILQGTHESNVFCIDFTSNMVRNFLFF